MQLQRARRNIALHHCATKIWGDRFGSGGDTLLLQEGALLLKEGTFRSIPGVCVGYKHPNPMEEGE
jgi:hypothetical protein